MPTVAITGVNGFIGRHAAAAFEAAGWSVVRLERSPSDGSAPYFLERALEPGRLSGVDVVLHLAYVPDAFDVNVAGARHLLTARQRDGGGRIMFVSSLTARPGTRSSYGQQKLAVERLLDPGRDLIVRPGLVVGDGGLFGRAVQQIRRTRVLPLIGGGRQPAQTVDVGDLAASFVRLASETAGGTFVVAADEVRTVKDLYREAAGCPVLALPVPYWLAGLLARVGVGGLTPDNVIGLREATYVAPTPGLPLPHADRS